MIPIRPHQPASEPQARNPLDPLALVDIRHYMWPGLLQLAALPPLALYIHIPWCLKKCPYCDFNSHEHSRQSLPEGRYVDALLADLQTCLPLVWGRQVISVTMAWPRPSTNTKRISPANVFLSSRISSR